MVFSSVRIIPPIMTFFPVPPGIQVVQKIGNSDWLVLPIQRNIESSGA
jgi:hypothetical protein